MQYARENEILFRDQTKCEHLRSHVNRLFISLSITFDENEVERKQEQRIGGDGQRWYL